MNWPRGWEVMAQMMNEVGVEEAWIAAAVERYYRKPLDDLTLDEELLALARLTSVQNRLLETCDSRTPERGDVQLAFASAFGGMVFVPDGTN